MDSINADINYAVALGEGLSKIAPSYYIYGNNEVEGVYDFPLNEKALDKKFGFKNDNRDEKALANLKDSFEEKLEKSGILTLRCFRKTIWRKKS